MKARKLASVALALETLLKLVALNNGHRFDCGCPTCMAINISVPVSLYFTFASK
ncbi:MAG: hypothetical protein HW403_906 [Dehalococcoidia bacterium]|nr:hypothetical protein [Dehalococcoidia bacterium]